MVLDVGAWDASRTINTPGQSGDPFSGHYRDLAPLWATGQYRAAAVQPRGGGSRHGGGDHADSKVSGAGLASDEGEGPAMPAIPLMETKWREKIRSFI
jgi:hypothetical protein